MTSQTNTNAPAKAGPTPFPPCVAVTCTRTGVERHRFPVAARAVGVRDGCPDGAPSGADLTLVRVGSDDVWVVLSADAARRASTAGASVLARMARLNDRPLTLDGWTYSCIITAPRVRILPAGTDLECPVCGLEIRTGDDCLSCDQCGAFHDSVWCGTGGRDTNACYRCGAPVDREGTGRS